MRILPKSISILIQVSGDPIDDEGGIVKWMYSVTALNLCFIPNVYHIASNDADFSTCNDIYSVRDNRDRCTLYKYASA